MIWKFSTIWNLNDLESQLNGKFSTIWKIVNDLEILNDLENCQRFGISTEWEILNDLGNLVEGPLCEVE